MNEHAVDQLDILDNHTSAVCMQTSIPSAKQSLILVDPIENGQSPTKGEQPSDDDVQKVSESQVERINPAYRCAEHDSSLLACNSTCVVLCLQL